LLRLALAPIQPSLSPELPGSALVQEIKRELKRLGCYSGRIDSNWATAELKLSIKKFVTFASLPSAPDEPTQKFLDGTGFFSAFVGAIGAFRALRWTARRNALAKCIIIHLLLLATGVHEGSIH
jgi:hypothetical protein